VLISIDFNISDFRIYLEFILNYLGP